VKTLLMFADRDFQVARELRACEEDLIQDLELDTVWDAMALGDSVVRDSARSAMLSGLATPGQIRYRQAVLTDCLQQPAVVREIYGLAVQAIDAERHIYRSLFSNHGEALLRRAISELEMFTGILKQLRRLTEDRTAAFSSEGFTQFFGTLRRELDDGYFDEVAQHLRQLRFHDGVLASAQLGEASQGTGYVLRTPRQENRGKFLFRRPAVRKPAYSLTVPPRDDGGAQALAALRDRALSLVANALGQSADHILSFFAALRTELGFYVGCLNLHDQLTAKAEPECLPDPHPYGASVLTARGLYDPCLSLRIPGRVHGNDLDTDGKPLVIITGANQGGKSTFLRSLGVAQLMMQAGMTVAAESFAGTISRGVFTHYKREEDATMTSGKFDEELARMSRITAAISTNCLLICNESFAATNEREGSEIAAEVIHAMTDTGNTVIFVTHLYELAHRLYQQHARTTLFLRADRGAGSNRTSRIAVGEPLPTSYGEDLYRRTFGAGPPAAAASPGSDSTWHDDAT
jgi:DNA mismatch repair ATPase MutS